ncbi:MULTISPECIES: tyrosine-type recombinase/integrase [unclassified Moraxella]|uniref:tyrosine-type recombinase/integrase n=1 Tax=unclassified Moraxella TaxID=2685852 RepID=UPI003AF5DF70
MNFLYILDFYSRNGLYQSNHDYAEKFDKLRFFANLSKITIDDIHDYCTLRNIQGVKNSTINRELTIARSAINYYNKHTESNLRNPFNGFNLFESDFLPRYLDKNECVLLLEACKQYANPAFYVYISLLLHTGSRSGEILSLEWDNVNIDSKYLVIRNSLSKNKKTIYKPLNNQAILAFKELGVYHHKYVFYNPKTDDRYKTFRRAWLWALEHSGLSCRIHDLRHTFASLLVSQGVPLYHVSQLLGHSDTRITQRYSHLSPDNLSSVVDLIAF